MLNSLPGQNSSLKPKALILTNYLKEWEWVHVIELDSRNFLPGILLFFN